MLGLNRQKFHVSVAMPLILFAASPALGQSASGAAPQAAAEAMDAGFDIIVTAQRRSERLRDVPIAITALNAEQMAKAGVGNLRDLERVTPALQMPMYGGFLRPSIRGISSGIAGSVMWRFEKWSASRRIGMTSSARVTTQWPP